MMQVPGLLCKSFDLGVGRYHRPLGGDYFFFGAIIMTICRPSRRGRDSITMSSPRSASIRARSEEHTSELQSLMRISYAVFCLKKKKQKPPNRTDKHIHTQTNYNEYPTTKTK